jgi:hypothetical protein
MPQRVKINRSERRPPFFSNLVKGDATQITPNGEAHNGPWPEEPRVGSIIGAENAIIPPADSWPGSNRSGE